ncbi:hypothetical protein COP1_030016 [Malus domestica]
MSLDTLQCLDPSDEYHQQIKSVEGEVDRLLEIDEIYCHQKSRVNGLKHGDKNTSFFHKHANYRAKRNLITGILDENNGWHRDENSTVQFDQGLNLPFTRHEIETAVKDIGLVKSPSPDGMPALFYKKYWNIVGDDVCNVCLSVLNRSSELGSLNKTLIVLIPKINLPKRVSEFCPISLCNVLYKIISKTPAMRMTKGIRQGDPISLYLFLIVPEGLSSLLQWAEDNSLIQCISIVPGAPMINHLFFADDNLMFCNAFLEEVNKLRRIFLIYKNALGQRINFAKLAVCFSSSTGLQTKMQIHHALGVPIVLCHERYLRLPTVMGRDKKKMF